MIISAISESEAMVWDSSENRNDGSSKIIGVPRNGGFNASKDSQSIPLYPRRIKEYLSDHVYSPRSSCGEKQTRKSSGCIYRECGPKHLIPMVPPCMFFLKHRQNHIYKRWTPIGESTGDQKDKKNVNSAPQFGGPQQNSSRATMHENVVPFQPSSPPCGQQLFSQIASAELGPHARVITNASTSNSLPGSLPNSVCSTPTNSFSTGNSGFKYRYHNAPERYYAMKDRHFVPSGYWTYPCYGGKWIENPPPTWVYDKITWFPQNAKNKGLNLSSKWDSECRNGDHTSLDNSSFSLNTLGKDNSCSRRKAFRQGSKRMPDTAECIERGIVVGSTVLQGRGVSVSMEGKSAQRSETSENFSEKSEVNSEKDSQILDFNSVNFTMNGVQNGLQLVDYKDSRQSSKDGRHSSKSDKEGSMVDKYTESHDTTYTSSASDALGTTSDSSVDNQTGQRLGGTTSDSSIDTCRLHGRSEKIGNEIPNSNETPKREYRCIRDPLHYRYRRDIGEAAKLPYNLYLVALRMAWNLTLRAEEHASSKQIYFLKNKTISHPKMLAGLRAKGNSLPPIITSDHGHNPSLGIPKHYFQVSSMEYFHMPLADHKYLSIIDSMDTKYMAIDQNSDSIQSKRRPSTVLPGICENYNAENQSPVKWVLPVYKAPVTTQIVELLGSEECNSKDCNADWENTSDASLELVGVKKILDRKRSASSSPPRGGGKNINAENEKKMPSPNNIEQPLFRTSSVPAGESAMMKEMGKSILSGRRQEVLRKWAEYNETQVKNEETVVQGLLKDLEEVLNEGDKDENTTDTDVTGKNTTDTHAVVIQSTLIENLFPTIDEKSLVKALHENQERPMRIKSLITNAQTPFQTPWKDSNAIQNGCALNISSPFREDISRPTRINLNAVSKNREDWQRRLEVQREIQSKKESVNQTLVHTNVVEQMHRESQVQHDQGNPSFPESCDAQLRPAEILSPQICDAEILPHVPNVVTRPSTLTEENLRRLNETYEKKKSSVEPDQVVGIQASEVVENPVGESQSVEHQYPGRGAGANGNDEPIDPRLRIRPRQLFRNSVDSAFYDSVEFVDGDIAQVGVDRHLQPGNAVEVGAGDEKRLPIQELPVEKRFLTVEQADRISKMQRQEFRFHISPDLRKDEAEKGDDYSIVCEIDENMVIEESGVQHEVHDRSLENAPVEKLDEAQLIAGVHTVKQEKDLEVELEEMKKRDEDMQSKKLNGLSKANKTESMEQFPASLPPKDDDSTPENLESPRYLPIGLVKGEEDPLPTANSSSKRASVTETANTLVPAKNGETNGSKKKEARTLLEDLQPPRCEDIPTLLTTDDAPRPRWRESLFGEVLKDCEQHLDRYQNPENICANAKEEEFLPRACSRLSVTSIVKVEEAELHQIGEQDPMFETTRSALFETSRSMFPVDSNVVETDPNVLDNNLTQPRVSHLSFASRVSARGSYYSVEEESEILQLLSDPKLSHELSEDYIAIEKERASARNSLLDESIVLDGTSGNDGGAISSDNASKSDAAASKTGGMSIGLSGKTIDIRAQMEQKLSNLQMEQKLSKLERGLDERSGPGRSHLHSGSNRARINSISNTCSSNNSSRPGSRPGSARIISQRNSLLSNVRGNYANSRNSSSDRSKVSERSKISSVSKVSKASNRSLVSNDILHDIVGKESTMNDNISKASTSPTPLYKRRLDAEVVSAAPNLIVPSAINLSNQFVSPMLSGRLVPQSGPVNSMKGKTQTSGAVKADHSIILQQNFSTVQQQNLGKKFGLTKTENSGLNSVVNSRRVDISRTPTMNPRLSPSTSTAVNPTSTTRISPKNRLSPIVTNRNFVAAGGIPTKISSSPCGAGASCDRKSTGSGTPVQCGTPLHSEGSEIKLGSQVPEMNVGSQEPESQIRIADPVPKIEIQEFRSETKCVGVVRSGLTMKSLGNRKNANPRPKTSSSNLNPESPIFASKPKFAINTTTDSPLLCSPELEQIGAALKNKEEPEDEKEHFEADEQSEEENELVFPLQFNPPTRRVNSSIAPGNNLFGSTSGNLVSPPTKPPVEWSDDSVSPSPIHAFEGGYNFRMSNLGIFVSTNGRKIESSASTPIHYPYVKRFSSESNDVFSNNVIGKANTFAALSNTGGGNNGRLLQKSPREIRPRASSGPRRKGTPAQGSDCGSVAELSHRETYREPHPELMNSRTEPVTVDPLLSSCYFESGNFHAVDEHDLSIVSDAGGLNMSKISNSSSSFGDGNCESLSRLNLSAMDRSTMVLPLVDDSANNMNESPQKILRKVIHRKRQPVVVNDESRRAVQERLNRIVNQNHCSATTTSQQHRNFNGTQLRQQSRNPMSQCENDNATPRCEGPYPGDRFCYGRFLQHNYLSEIPREKTVSVLGQSLPIPVGKRERLGPKSIRPLTIPAVLHGRPLEDDVDEMTLFFSRKNSYLCGDNAKSEIEAYRAHLTEAALTDSTTTFAGSTTTLTDSTALPGLIEANALTDSLETNCSAKVVGNHHQWLATSGWQLPSSWWGSTSHSASEPQMLPTNYGSHPTTARNGKRGNANRCGANRANANSRTDEPPQSDDEPHDDGPSGGPPDGRGPDPVNRFKRQENGIPATAMSVLLAALIAKRVWPGDRSDNRSSMVRSTQLLLDRLDALAGLHEGSCCYSIKKSQASRLAHEMSTGKTMLEYLKEVEFSDFDLETLRDEDQPEWRQTESYYPESWCPEREMHYHGGNQHSRQHRRWRELHILSDNLPDKPHGWSYPPPVPEMVSWDRVVRRFDDLHAARAPTRAPTPRVSPSLRSSPAVSLSSRIGPSLPCSSGPSSPSSPEGRSSTFFFSSNSDTNRISPTFFDAHHISQTTVSTTAPSPTTSSSMFSREKDRSREIETEERQRLQQRQAERRNRALDELREQYREVQYEFLKAQKERWIRYEILRDHHFLNDVGFIFTRNVFNWTELKAEFDFQQNQSSVEGLLSLFRLIQNLVDGVSIDSESCRRWNLFEKNEHLLEEAYALNMLLKQLIAPDSCHQRRVASNKVLFEGPNSEKGLLWSVLWTSPKKIWKHPQSANNSRTVHTECKITMFDLPKYLPDDMARGRQEDSTRQTTRNVLVEELLVFEDS